MKHRRKHPSIHTLLLGWKVPVASGGTQVGIQSVSPNSDDTLQWNFTSPVVHIPSLPSNVPQLTASPDGTNFVAPSSVSIVDGGVAATYAGQTFTPGSIFSVDTPPAGIGFTDGTLSVPQLGQVISQEAAAELKTAVKKIRKTKKVAKKNKTTPKAKKTSAKRHSPLRIIPAAKGRTLRKAA